MRKRYEAIRSFLEGDLHIAELTLAERQHYNALKVIESMWADGKTDSSIRTVLFENHDMSDSSARRAMNDAVLVFGDLRVIDRKLSRYRASQMAMKAYELAAGKDDYKGMISATKVYIEAEGINNEDPNLPPLEQMEPGLNVIMLPEGMEEMIMAQLAAGRVDQTQAPLPLTIDITHDEEVD